MSGFGEDALVVFRDRFAHALSDSHVAREHAIFLTPAGRRIVAFDDFRKLQRRDGRFSD